MMLGQGMQGMADGVHRLNHQPLEPLQLPRLGTCCRAAMREATPGSSLPHHRHGGACPVDVAISGTRDIFTFLQQAFSLRCR